MTDDIVKVKFSIALTLVLQLIALVYFMGTFQARVQARLDVLEKQLETIHTTRWTSEAHDRYAREIERRLTKGGL